LLNPCGVRSDAIELVKRVDSLIQNIALNPKTHPGPLSILQRAFLWIDSKPAQVGCQCLTVAKVHQLPEFNSC
jgi:hypothetical protein